MADGYEPSGLTPAELAALPPYEQVAGLTFVEIEALYDEETAINVGIATDPDAWVPTPEEWAQARPAIEVDPHLVKAWQAGKFRGPAKEYVTIPIDHDLLDHFRKGGPDWHSRLNDTLRQAVCHPAPAPSPAASDTSASARLTPQGLIQEK